MKEDSDLRNQRISQSKLGKGESGNGELAETQDS
jgi:hypothetical protein